MWRRRRWGRCKAVGGAWCWCASRRKAGASRGEAARAPARLVDRRVRQHGAVLRHGTRERCRMQHEGRVFEGGDRRGRCQDHTILDAAIVTLAGHQNLDLPRDAII